MKFEIAMIVITVLSITKTSLAENHRDVSPQTTRPVAAEAPRDCGEGLGTILINHSGKGLNFSTYSLFLTFSSNGRRLEYTYDYGINSSGTIDLGRMTAERKGKQAGLASGDRDPHWVLWDIKHDLEVAKERVQAESAASRARSLSVIACAMEKIRLWRSQATILFGQEVPILTPAVPRYITGCTGLCGIGVSTSLTDSQSTRVEAAQRYPGDSTAGVPTSF